MKNPELVAFRNSRTTAIKDSRKVATLIRVVSGKALPDPLQVYESVLQKSRLPACLLESATHEKGKGRYSFICLFGRPFCIMRKMKSLASLKRGLRDISPLPHEKLPFVGGALGYIGHEAITGIEKTVKPHSVDTFNLPMVALYCFHCIIVLDHKTNTLYYVVNVPTSWDVERGYNEGCRLIKEMKQHVSDSVNVRSTQDVAEMEKRNSNLTDGQYMDMVKKAKQHIIRGDVFQVVLSRCISVPFQGNGVSLYGALRRVNPSPYLFHMRTDKNCGNAILLGSSPEIMADIRNREMVIRPLAGTRRRGKTPAGDKRNEHALVNNKKERAEHKMLVDLALNDVRKFCDANSVTVPKLMEPEYFSHVIHIASEVRGKLRDDIHPLDACLGSLPAGTLSGCPKVRALQLIAELEPCQRGPYGGAFGWFTDQSLDTCIFIRSGLLLGGVFYWQTGAGIVYDSNPKAEYFETEKKAAAMKKALEEMQKTYGKADYEKTKKKCKASCGS